MKYFSSCCDRGSRPLVLVFLITPTDANQCRILKRWLHFSNPIIAIIFADLVMVELLLSGTQCIEWNNRAPIDRPINIRIHLFAEFTLSLDPWNDIFRRS